MKLRLAILYLASLTADCVADSFPIPPLTQPFSVRVMLRQPSSQFRGPNMAMPIKQATPDFPLRMRGMAIDEVVVWFTVGVDGIPTKIRILRHSQKEFDEAVLAAVSIWRFSPAKKDGKAVAMDLEYGIRFDIPPEP